MMRFLSHAVSACLATVFVACHLAAVAPDAGNRKTPKTEYFDLDVGAQIATFDKSHIISDPPIIEASFYQMDSTPRVVVPLGVEAYLLEPERRNNEYRGYRIVGRKPQGQAVTVKFFVLRRHPDQPRESCLAKFVFQVDGNVMQQPPRKDFLRAKGLHYQRFWSEDFAGSAMFRHLAVKSLGEVGETAQSIGPNWPMRRNAGIDETITLMSGGRAVSENLQLDQQLQLPEKSADVQLPLSNVQGITIREIDWDRFLKNEPTELDPLAKLIPHDQYAVYLSSFQALADLVHRGGEAATPAVQWFEPQSRKTDVMGFYQTQLGLPLNALTRQIGKALIREVALTGSDPYFRTGTDVAVLMSSDQAELLHQSILTQVSTQAGLHTNVQKIRHQISGYEFEEWSTQNRKLSAFVARQGQHVIVSNSRYQMLQILKSADGKTKSMHQLDEYRFFRQRYPLRIKEESALVVVTDAAIRRWCGPAWRIGASRRTRARASIAELTMRHADDLVLKTLRGTTEIHSADGMPEIGVVSLTADGVYAHNYGTLDFQTPIAEMELTHASKQEIELYENWRTRYERRWRRAFDPIALQLTLTDKSIAADLSVIPLMIRSDYRQFMQLVGNQRLKPEAGDPHPTALADFTIAVDVNAPVLQMARMILDNNPTNINLLEWIDGSASLYFEHDEQWFKNFKKRSPWDMGAEDLIHEFPVGVFIPSKNNLRMTAFLVAVRAALQRFSPNMFQWQSVKYRDYEYVVGTVVGGTAIGRAEDMPRIYYVTTGRGLTVSTNQTVVESVVDRQLADAKAPQDEGAGEQSAPPWEVSDADLAPQLKMQATGKGIDLMNRTSSRSGLRRMNRIAWGNIPIMNYFRHRYPDRDPVAVYRTLFGEQLIEPSGGAYVWDEDLRTYVSNHHGYHLQPKAGPVTSPVLAEDDLIQTAISFQDGGLRATLRLETK